MICANNPPTRETKVQDTRTVVSLRWGCIRSYRRQTIGQASLRIRSAGLATALSPNLRELLASLPPSALSPDAAVLSATHHDGTTATTSAPACLFFAGRDETPRSKNVRSGGAAELTPLGDLSTLHSVHGVDPLGLPKRLAVHRLTPGSVLALLCLGACVHNASFAGETLPLTSLTDRPTRP